jgi:hypothetical protein
VERKHPPAAHATIQVMGLGAVKKKGAGKKTMAHYIKGGTSCLENNIVDKTLHMRRKELVLISTALSIGAIGLGYLISPQFMLSFYGVTVDSVTEASIIRSSYGGLFFGFSLLLLFWSLNQNTHKHALLALLAFMGGFASGRIVSLSVDGMPGPLVFVLILIEVTYAVFACYFLSCNKGK